MARIASTLLAVVGFIVGFGQGTADNRIRVPVRRRRR